jgi:hypothetical protein
VEVEALVAVQEGIMGYRVEPGIHQANLQAKAIMVDLPFPAQWLMAVAAVVVQAQLGQMDLLERVGLAVRGRNPQLLVVL